MNNVARVVARCLCLVIILAACGHAPAYGLPSIPVLDSSGFAGVKVIPEIQIGYEKLWLNFNLPAALASGLPPYPSTLDLKFRDANLWVGTLSAAIEFPSGLAAVIKGQANAKRNIIVYEGEEFALGATQGVTWTGSQLEWWALEGRVAYRFIPDCSVMIGLRGDHLAVNLLNPRDGNGNPLNLDDSEELAPFLTFSGHQRYYSDLMSKLWIPYVGLEIVGPGYRASLLGSPFAWAEMKVPVELLLDLITVLQIPPFPPAIAELLTAEGLLYRVNKPAVFLEANFQYDFNLFPALNVGLWCSASWLSLKGHGN